MAKAKPTRYQLGSLNKTDSSGEPTMPADDYPSIERIQQCFRYEDGRLFWLVRPRSHFAHDQAWKCWNTKHAGSEAGGSHKFKGKRGARYVVSINGVDIFRHLIVWALHHGEWKFGLDHEDRDSSNDRIENLRPATVSQNNANATRYRNNTSGHKGVSWHKRQQKWVARIMVNSKAIQIGSFDRASDAHAAYTEAATHHFGEFAHAGA
jgi:hypothetical protein